MAQYNAGTVALTSGSATVTGTGTSWVGNVTPGDYVYFPGVLGSWRVNTVVSNTSLTLTAPYNGSLVGAGRSYTIARDFSPLLKLPLMRKGDIETAQIYSDAMGLLESKVGTLVTPPNPILSTSVLISAPAASTTYPLVLRTPGAIQILNCSRRCNGGTSAAGTFHLFNGSTGSNVTGYSNLSFSGNGVTTTTQTVAVAAGQTLYVQVLSTSFSPNQLMVQIDYRLV
jgi:hypothetical protein